MAEGVFLGRGGSANVESVETRKGFREGLNFRFGIAPVAGAGLDGVKERVEWKRSDDGACRTAGSEVGLMRKRLALPCRIPATELLGAGGHGLGQAGRVGRKNRPVLPIQPSLEHIRKRAPIIPAPRLTKRAVSHRSKRNTSGKAPMRGQAVAGARCLNA